MLTDHYDAIARGYADAFADQFDQRPFDRGFLASFARSVLTAGGRSVLDVGCGPGPATRELTAAGLDAVGIDRSSALVSIARERGGNYLLGDMTALPIADASVDAVCAWYSIVHTPADELAALFGEFRRVLVDDGWLLLAFQTAAPTLELREAFGMPVDLDFLRHDTHAVQVQLMDSGYLLHRDASRSADARTGETAAQSFVIARKA